MANAPDASRRRFVGDVGRLASGLALTAAVPGSARALTAAPPHVPRTAPPLSAAPGDWDLSWLDRVAAGTDRAVFDWPSLGKPADSIVLQIASRYMENCASVYAAGSYQLRIVMNIRTTAVPAALSDATWARFKLGEEYGVDDHATKERAVRNPFLHRAHSDYPGIVLPTLTDLLDADATVLVCDFALGHLAKSLATKENAPVDAIHRELRAGFVQNAYAVPSGIFGLAKAQNAGCAFVRM